MSNLEVVVFSPIYSQPYHFVNLWSSSSWESYSSPDLFNHCSFIHPFTKPITQSSDLPTSSHLPFQLSLRRRPRPRTHSFFSPPISLPLSNSPFLPLLSTTLVISTIALSSRSLSFFSPLPSLAPANSLFAHPGVTHCPKQRGHCVNPPKMQRRK